MSATAAQDPILKAAYERLPDVLVQSVTEGGASITILNELQRGTTNVGIALADVAYLASAGLLDGASGPFDQLRGMAMLNVNTFHFLVASRTHIRSLQDLKGRRVALGPVGTSTALIAATLLSENGLTLADVGAERVPYTEVAERLIRGDLDAAFMTQIIGSDPVVRAIRGGAELRDIDGAGAERLRLQRPFLRRTVIPAGSYPGQDKAIHTLGVDRVMICRADVSEDVVYRLLDSFFATRPGQTPPADLERAPATPLPLHVGAARYYRQRELSR